MRHFISTAERVLHMDFKLDETQIGNRFVRVDALPMGIDYEKIPPDLLDRRPRAADRPHAGPVRRPETGAFG